MGFLVSSPASSGAGLERQAERDLSVWGWGAIGIIWYVRGWIGLDERARLFYQGYHILG